MKLANGIVAYDFDPATGSLARIEDLRTKVAHEFDRAYARLLRVNVPDPERLIDRFADSHASGKPGMEKKSGQLTIHYPNLVTPEGEATGVAATVLVTLAPGDDEAQFVVRLDNHGAFPIHEIRFPWIGGWTGCAGPGKDVLTTGTNSSDPFRLRNTGNGYTLGKSHRRDYTSHRGMMVTFADISGGGRGISYVHYPTRPRQYAFVAEDLNDCAGSLRLGLSWVDRPFVKPGESWTSDPTGLAPHSGDWHDSADRLRRWLATWWKAPASPRRLRSAIGYQCAFFRDFLGRDLRPLSDLPKLARYGLSLGIKDFSLWDMMMAVYLRAGTDAFFEDTPERLAEMSRALEETRAMGVQVNTLLNSRLITEHNRLWKEFGEEWVVRTLSGARTVESWPWYPEHASLFTSYLDQGGYRLCQSNPAYQEWAVDLVKRGLDMGFTSMFIDQAFGEDLCFAASHGHDVPAHVHEGAAAWSARATEMVHRRDPEGYTIGEIPDIWTTQSIDMWWFWGWSAVKSEVFRYVLPDSIQSWVIDACEHGHEVGKAFSQGYLLAMNVQGLEKTLLDVPDFARRVKELAALRAKTRDVTTEGRFVDKLGLSLDTDGSIWASAYDSDGNVGVVLGDTTAIADSAPARGNPVKVTIDLAEYDLEDAPRQILIHRQDGTIEEVAPSARGNKVKVETRLGKWESAVIEIA